MAEVEKKIEVKKMAHKKGKAKTPRIIKIVVWAAISLIIVITIIVATWFFWPAAPAEKISMAPAPTTTAVDYPLCSNESDVWIEDKNYTAQVNLGGVGCWSARIHLPADRNVNLVVSEELHGIKFWGGKVLNRSDLVGYQQQTDGWFADITHKVFRLRGIGTATVRIEKIKT